MPTIYDTIWTWIRNGFHIHAIHALIHSFTTDVFLSTTIAVKLYSLNYFYWYGHLYTYLPNPRHNWVKQFIRFTDQGHVASFALLIGPYFMANFTQRFLPLAHNIHFIIMIVYWGAKLAFDMKDADRMCGSDIIEWHMDVLTYIHHTIPYMLILYLWNDNYSYDTNTNTNIIYNYNTTLFWTYGWLYGCFFCVYWPWRLYTGDTVYSIMDPKQTPTKVTLIFIGVIHLVFYVSNVVGYYVLNHSDGLA